MTLCKMIGGKQVRLQFEKKDASKKNRTNLVVARQPTDPQPSKRVSFTEAPRYNSMRVADLENGKRSSLVLVVEDGSVDFVASERKSKLRRCLAREKVRHSKGMMADLKSTHPGAAYSLIASTTCESNEPYTSQPRRGEDKERNATSSPRATSSSE